MTSSSTYAFNVSEAPVSPQYDNDEHDNGRDHEVTVNNRTNNGNHDGLFISSSNNNSNRRSKGILVGPSENVEDSSSFSYSNYNTMNNRYRCTIPVLISIIVVLLASNIALLSSSLSNDGKLHLSLPWSLSSSSIPSSAPKQNKISTMLYNATLPLFKYVPPISDDTLLSRIAFGSCLSQNMPQPIWDTLMMKSSLSPDIFILMGDNVYGDCSSDECSELKQAYYDWSLHPSLQSIAQQIPFIATLDDHDYGLNNCNRHNPYQENAKRCFREFFNLTTDQLPWHDGVYQSFLYYKDDDSGQGKRRTVQIIVLDTRYDRSPFIETNNVSSPYRPVEEDDGKDDIIPYQMLGEFQWQWFEGQIKQTKADIRIIVSSIQVLNNVTGFEAWRQIPTERERLYNLLQNEKAIIISGDRHVGGIYESNNLIEITASSVTHSIPLGTYDNCHTTQDCDEMDPSRISGPLIRENHYGSIEIDWENEEVTLALRRAESSYGSSYHHPSTEQYHHPYPLGDAGDILTSKTYKFTAL